MSAAQPYSVVASADGAGLTMRRSFADAGHAAAWYDELGAEGRDVVLSAWDEAAGRWSALMVWSGGAELRGALRAMW